MHKQRDGFLLPSSLLHGVVFQPVISFFKGLVPEVFQFFNWENALEHILIAGGKLGKHLVREEACRKFHILFQGFWIFAWDLNIAGVRHAQLFAEAGHEVPVDVARMLSMAPTLGNGEQLFMLCPI